VVSATVLVSAVLVVLANLLVDVFNSLLDPRTSFS
jgi:ABC-type dipeptide/oligopeptide/nickel transport system permease component